MVSYTKDFSNNDLINYIPKGETTIAESLKVTTLYNNGLMGVATFKDNVNINGDLQVNNGSIGGNLDVIGNLNVGGNISFPGQAFLLARKTGETNYSSSNTITYDNVIVKKYCDWNCQTFTAYKAGYYSIFCNWFGTGLGTGCHVRMYYNGNYI